MLCHMGDAAVRRPARRASVNLCPGGVTLLLHWTGPADDPLTADQAAEAFIAEAGLNVRAASRKAEYRMGVLTR